MDIPVLEAQLNEYRQQLALLDQNDIRIPNQSLILDFFCIDEQFTEFLRGDVFTESASRYRAWVHMNTRESDLRHKITGDDLSTLLECSSPSARDAWRSIIRYTAKQQNNIASLNILDTLAKSLESSADDSTTKPIVSSGSSPNQAEDLQDTSTKVIHLQANHPDSKSSHDPIGSNIVKRKEPNYPGIFAGSISGILILVGIIASAINQPSSSLNEQATSSSDYSASSSSADDLAGLTKLENDARTAVLRCELLPIIEQANSLNLSDPSLVARKNSLISAANKSIAFLDQPSRKGFKYWEDSSCTWGEQWFDKQAENGFRVFIAVSNKCSNPKIHYSYSKDKDNKQIMSQDSRTLNAHKKGEILLPFINSESVYYAHIQKVSCN